MLAVAVAVLWWGAAGPRPVDAGDLTVDLRKHLGREVIVIGEWVMSGPSPKRGYMVVVLGGPHGSRVACHFEDVPALDRVRLEKRLNLPKKVTVHGRCDGVEDGQVVLRGCTLLD
jgi:hypothetical protein